MNLFEYKGPREYLGDGCMCSALIIESIVEVGNRLVANGKLTILDTVKYGLNYNGPWLAEFIADRKIWFVYRPPGPTCRFFDKDGNPEFLLINEVNVAVKAFVAKQLKIFCFEHMQIEIDPDDDLPPNKVRTPSGKILAVSHIL